MMNSWWNCLLKLDEKKRLNALVEDGMKMKYVEVEQIRRCYKILNDDGRKNNTKRI